MTTAALRRNKKARDFKRFEAFIKAPAVIGGGFVMPANGRIGISSPAGGVLSVTVNGKVITTPNLAANQVFRLPWVERNKTISGFTAGANLVVFDEWMAPYKIAS